MRNPSKRKGFTLIELLVTIAIIAILTAIIMVNVGQARAGARDKQRIAELAQANLAFEVYHNAFGTYHIPDTGSGGNGEGWFAYDGGNYEESIAQGLVDAGMMSSVLHDPLVPANSSGSGGHAQYMRYFPNGDEEEGSCMFAELEQPTDAHEDAFDDAPISSGTRSQIAGYGMNYADCI